MQQVRLFPYIFGHSRPCQNRSNVPRGTVRLCEATSFDTIPFVKHVVLFSVKGTRSSNEVLRKRSHTRQPVHLYLVRVPSLHGGRTRRSRFFFLPFRVVLEEERERSLPVADVARGAEHGPAVRARLDVSLVRVKQCLILLSSSPLRRLKRARSDLGESAGRRRRRRHGR